MISDILEMLGRGLVFMLAVAFIGWRVYRRWKGAGEYVQEMQEEERRQRAAFAQMPWDPAFARLKAYLDGRYRTTLDTPPDPAVFRIHYATFLDQLSQPTWPGLPARWLVAYLQAKQGRIAVMLDIVSGHISEGSLGWLQWTSVVPVWAR